MNSELIIPHLGILTTTYCNLNCRDCADCIPKRQNCIYDINDIKSDVQKILSAVDYIEEVLVIGGEVLLHQELLIEVLDFCRKQDKIGQLIITTNGTIIPKDNLLASLKRNNVLVRVSGYPKTVAPKRAEIISLFKNADINVSDMKNMTWLSMGDTNKRNHTEAELKAIFSTCGMRACVTISCEGKLFYCSRQMSAYETDIYPKPYNYEYVDVRNSNNLEEDLEKFYNLEYISTCDYCDGISCVTKYVVPTAVQILPKKDFLQLLTVYTMWTVEELPVPEILQTITDVVTLMERYEQSLIPFNEYSELCNSITAFLETQTIDNYSIMTNALRELINVLSKDYNYFATENVLFRKVSATENMPNIITVGMFPEDYETTADILISSDEINTALTLKYPLDTILYNRLYIESKLEKLKNSQIKCIICGLSYTQYGIIEKYMPVPTVNLSITGQDIPYSILLAQKAIAINKDIETIIIPISYFQGCYDISADDAYIHEAVMSQINIPLFGDARNYGNKPYITPASNPEYMNIYDNFIDFDIMQIQRNASIKVELQNLEFFNDKYMNAPPTGGLKFDFKTLDMQKKYESAKITADLNERVCNSKAYEEVKKCLTAFLENPTIKNKKIIFFVPPMTKYLYAAYHMGLYSFYYDKIVPILTKYDNVIFCDLANSSSFEDNDFADFEHLNNSSGAIKLSVILSDLL